jgi:hypothetical protein
MASATNYDEGQWVTTFMAGSELIPDESITPQVRSDVSGAAISELDSVRVNDAFRSGPSFGIETGYMSQSNLEPFVRLNYSKLEGRNTAIGSIDATDLSTSAAIGANFGDMEVVGAQSRHALLPQRLGHRTHVRRRLSRRQSAWTR